MPIISRTLSYEISDIKILNMRIWNLCRALRIKTLLELAQWHYNDLLEQPNIGIKTLKDADQLLKEHGLILNRFSPTPDELLQKAGLSHKIRNKTSALSTLNLRVNEFHSSANPTPLLAVNRR